MNYTGAKKQQLNLINGQPYSGIGNLNHVTQFPSISL